MSAAVLVATGAQLGGTAHATTPDPCVVPTIPAPAPTGGLKNPHSVTASAGAMGASAYYNDGYFGQGVDVALIDSGVVPVSGLDGANVVHGPDLSFEAMSPYAHVDTFGHGTHLAGIIAGNGPTFTGIAPLSRVVSVKVADSAGVTDVTQVIAAIDWVVQHRHDNGLNIRVLNLSYGVAALDSWQSDVLSFAVDQAWRAGIVVVAAAGNDGETSNNTRSDTGLDAPAYNRNIIAVGAYDPVTGVADYSSSASSANKRMPDVVAPGTSILSLHDPGSTQDLEIADECHAALAAGDAWTMPVSSDLSLVAGSGTSQATAMVSAAAALMLSKDATLNPDTVKARLRADARTLHGDNAGNQGEGAVDLRSVALDTRVAQAVGLKANETVSNNLTTHALDDARGGDALDVSGTKLSGNRNIAGAPIGVPSLENAEFANANLHYTNATWIADDSTESWLGGPFQVGTEFHERRLVASANEPQLVLDDRPWPGTDFAGRAWGAHDWSTSPQWDGHKWRGDGWAVGSWFGSNFATGEWSGHKWRGVAWSSAYWGTPAVKRSHAPVRRPPPPPPAKKRRAS